MIEKILQLSLNGLMAGAVLAVPAIGLTMIFAVLRFVNFSVAGHMAVGAFAGYVLNAWCGLPAWRREVLTIWSISLACRLPEPGCL